MQIYCNVKRHLCIETPKGFVMVLCFTDLRQEDKSEWLVRVLRNPFPYLLTPQEISTNHGSSLISFDLLSRNFQIEISKVSIHVGKASCFCRSHFAGALWETLSVRSRKARGVFRGPWQPCGQPWCRSSFIQDRWWEEILYERHLKASRYLMNLVFGARKLRMVDGFGASEVVVESPTHNALIGIAEDCQVARCSKKSALF